MSVPPSAMLGALALAALTLLGCSQRVSSMEPRDAGPAVDDASDAASPLTESHWPPGGSALPLPARDRCDDGSLAPGDYDATLPVGGALRTWHLHVPSSYVAATPVPVLLAFHGGGQNAATFEAMASLRAKSDAASFLLVEPEGAPALDGQSASFPFESWNAGNCCAASSADDVDDVAFVSAILDALATAACFDRSRVYATGFSNGAMLTYRLACALSTQIAAIAPVSGGSGQFDRTTGAELYACAPSRPVPVLHVHGTGDTCYPFDGGLGALSGVDFEPVPTTVATWRGRNGCDPDAAAGTVTQQGEATCEAYTCPAAGAITLCVVPGGGHYWPGGAPWLGSTTLCPGNGSLAPMPVVNDLLWTFLSRYSSGAGG